jgi:hypothetical protein
LKGTAARADGLVIKFERADAVEDIMTKARGPRIGLMAWHECAMPRAGSASTRAESVFVDGELFTVLAALVCLHLVELNLFQGEICLQLKGQKVTRWQGTTIGCSNVISA